MFTCGGSLAAMIAVDSALNLGELSNAGRAELRALVPASKRRLIDHADPRCDSGLETIARMLPRGKRIPHRTQFYIPGVVRLTYDMVVHDWERVRADLLAIIERGEHRWGARAYAWAR